MITRRRDLINRSALCGAAALLLVSGCGERREPPAKAPAKQVFALSVHRQLPLEKGSALPVAYNNGLILADESGGIRCLDAKLDPLWVRRVAGADFKCSGTVYNGRLLLASRTGKVCALDAQSGTVIWEKALDGAFSQPPLCGRVDGEDVVWLLSQGDGMVHALKAADGTLLWSGSETNRSDGNAALWQLKLAYGNCDGAVHLFNAVTGRLLTSIAVGDSDQMAGTPLATAGGVLWIGTREGRLALVDLASEKLLATLKISEEEAFVTPVAAFDTLVAAGVGEGGVLLCRSEAGQILVVKEQSLAGGIDALLYDGTLLYALAAGTLTALNAELQSEASLNLGDKADGMVELENGLLAVMADQSLLLIKGEWK